MLRRLTPWLLLAAAPGAHGSRIDEDPADEPASTSYPSSGEDDDQILNGALAADGLRMPAEPAEASEEVDPCGEEEEEDEADAPPQEPDAKVQAYPGSAGVGGLNAQDRSSGPREAPANKLMNAPEATAKPKASLDVRVSRPAKDPVEQGEKEAQLLKEKEALEEENNALKAEIERLKVQHREEMYDAKRAADKRVQAVEEAWKEREAKLEKQLKSQIHEANAKYQMAEAVAIASDHKVEEKEKQADERVKRVNDLAATRVKEAAIGMTKKLVEARSQKAPKATDPWTAANAEEK